MAELQRKRCQPITSELSAAAFELPPQIRSAAHTPPRIVDNAEESADTNIPCRPAGSS